MEQFRPTPPLECLRIVRWAKALAIEEDQQLLNISLAERGFRMAHSNATGEGLVSNGRLGVDLIRLKAGNKFLPHTHPSDHLLIVVGGKGTITYEGEIHPTEAGQVYLIDGQKPHAVGAITDHTILAVGSPHRPVDSPDRMKIVQYEEVLSDISTLHCLIDDIRVEGEERLHEKGCSHCPCPNCE